MDLTTNAVCKHYHNYLVSLDVKSTKVFYLVYIPTYMFFTGMSYVAAMLLMYLDEEV